MNIALNSPQQTEMFGAALGRALPEQCIIFLHGDLGAGKTSLVRGVMRGAGFNGAVKSPTYTLVEEYQLQQRLIFHFDLYRLKDPEELEWIGIDDYFQQTAQCFIEWPEMGEGELPPADLEITLTMPSEGRNLAITEVSEKLKDQLNIQWQGRVLRL